MSIILLHDLTATKIGTQMPYLMGSSQIARDWSIYENIYRTILKNLGLYCYIVLLVSLQHTLNLPASHRAKSF